ncbi:hypothetical protein D9M68_464030 [compost metagenome]
MVGKHVAVVLDVLAELLLVGVLEPGLEPGEHLVDGQLRGRVGVVVRERNVGRFARRDAEADAHDLRDHFVERGGLGVDGREFGGLEFGEPGVELRPLHDRVVLQVARGRGGLLRVQLGGLVEQAALVAIGLGSGLLLGVLFDQLGRYFLRFERLDQALETELLVEGLQLGRLRRADRQAFERGQAFDKAVQVAVGADGDEAFAQRQLVERLAQVFAGGALHFGGAFDQRIERAVFEQPFRGGLRADLGHAGHVVDRVADERLVVDHEAGRHAELGRHAGDVALLAVHRVDDGDVLVDQLAQVLVAAGHDHFDALRGRHLGERADHVVGLDIGHREHRPAQQLDHFVDGVDLAAQVVGHRRAVGLVLGVPVVAEGLAGGVEDAGRVVGAHLAAQRGHHVDHAPDRPGGRALGVAGHGAQIGHRVEGPVQVARAIDEQQRFLVGHRGILPCPDRRPEPHQGRPAADTPPAGARLQSAHA